MLNTKKLLLIIAAISIVAASCSTLSVREPCGDDCVSIGTFNIEWLGDGIDDNKPRTDDEYKRIAEVIKDTKFEVIGLQEIENAEALDKIIKYLPGYKYHISSGYAKQNVAVLFKDNIDLQYVGDYAPIAVKDGRTRPGMFLKARKGNFDWYMMVVHFKATSRYDDTPEKREESIVLRSRQAAALSNWVDSVLTHDAEQDLILVGDFNDFPNRQGGSALTALLENSNVEFLTKDVKGCKYREWFVIDQIVISNSAKKRLLKNSLFMNDFYSKYKKEEAAQISDHCPIGVSFDIVQPDND